LLGPIFAREWLTVPRRPRHYVVRAAYLGLLWVIGITAWQVTVGWNQTATLGDNARFSLMLFQVLAVAQLGLLPFLAGLSAASAVSQEKDRRTFILLLLTDLRSYEIVLGKLLGSLLQIGLLWLGMMPVLALMVLLGGVAPHQVVQAALILAATALVAGSVGNLVALWRERTFQSLALTVLFLLLYICVVRALPIVASWLPMTESYLPAVEHWQTRLDPFLALQSVLEEQGEHIAAVHPAYGFASAMLILSILLNAWGIMRLRVWNPSGEPIMQRERPEHEELDRAKAHAAPGAVRRVWANPILWREMKTRAYGRRPLLVKLAYGLVLALVCYYALSPLWTTEGQFASQGLIPAAAKGLVPVTILSLLLVSAQAVTAITTERDTGALDLLLVTDLSPQEFIFGKLAGILYNAKEFLLPPLILACVYAGLQLLGTPPALHPEMAAYKNSESLVCVMGALLMLLAFATMLGVHVALRTENSRLAVINTLATMFFLSIGTMLCIFLIVINTRRFEYQWTSFLMFIAAGMTGFWWVLSGDRPSPALTLASCVCPLALFYTITFVLVGKPGSQESADPVIPFLVTAAAFGFTIAAMLIPLLSEFDVALGRTTGGGE
jgi:ABC-type transport system involved in multi-copper enzyme maturation permease subunit